MTDNCKKEDVHTVNILLRLLIDYYELSDAAYVSCLRSLSSLGNFEFNLLTVF